MVAKGGGSNVRKARQHKKMRLILNLELNLKMVRAEKRPKMVSESYVIDNNI